MKPPVACKRGLVGLFFSRIRLAGQVVAEFHMHTACWIWIGKPYPSGYAYFKFRGGRTQAHRFAFRMLRTFLPRYKGRMVHHRCHNPICVNPEHLQMVTFAQHRAKHPQHASRGADGRFVREAGPPTTLQGAGLRRKKDGQISPNGRGRVE